MPGVAVAGGTVPLTVRRSPRARRVILRIDVGSGRVVLTVPPKTSVAQALAFAESKKEWIRDRLAVLPPRTAFADAAVVPLFGLDHRVRHAPGLSGGVRVGNREIIVGGAEESVGKRVETWLRRAAQAEIARRVADKAGRLGIRAERVTVRDTHSRWGSCSPAGRLSFSWRLIMAPVWVLDYVVAHEVAHLQERGHGPAFWRTVALLSDDIDGAHRWLRDHGAMLHRFG